MEEEVKEQPQAEEQSQATEEQAAQDSKQAQSENDERANWQRIRAEKKTWEEEKRRLQQEADYYRLMAEKKAETPAQKEAVQQMSDADILSQMDDDDWATAKAVKSTASALQREIEALKKEREEEKKRNAEEKRQRELARIKAERADIAQVCSDENLAWLEYKYPEEAAAIASCGDDAKKLTLAYSFLKKMMPNPQAEKDRVKVEANASKPKPMQGMPNPVPDSNAPHMLSREQKDQIWKRAQQYANSW